MHAWTGVSCRFVLHRPAYKFRRRQILRLIGRRAHRHGERERDGCNQGAALTVLNLRDVMPMQHNF
jgi:hypothetical protein